MIAFWQSRSGWAGTARGSAAVLMVVVYLFVGLAHSHCCFGLADTASGSVVSATLDEGTDLADKGALAGHHCHGCFAATVPAIAQPLQQAALPLLKWQLPPPQLTGQAPSTDTPPPKYLI